MLVVWIVAQNYERNHSPMTGQELGSPSEYYGAAGLQSVPLVGAEGGAQPSAIPTGVLRKGGQSCFAVV